MPLRTFTCQAMATGWEFYLLHDEPSVLEEAGRAALGETAKLEAELTRFRPDSDIGRINSLGAGQSTPVGPAAMDCLLLARDVHAATGGAFDVTIGPLFACWVGPDHTPRRASKAELEEAAAHTGMHLLDLRPEEMRVAVRADGMHVDLGGIGKGYALDQIADLLRHVHGLENFLLNAGDSTVLASGPGPDGEGWGIRTGLSPEPILLRDAALSGSGTSVQGEHIIDPRTRRPASLRHRDHVWVRTSLASVADAFSTAFLVLSPEECAAVCARHPEIEWLRPEATGRRGRRRR